nr:outer membrane beta-barrel protein [Sphingomonas arenae]
MIGAAAALAAVPAEAQELDRAAPLIEAPQEFAPTPIRIGAGTLGLGLDARGEYIDNLYSLPDNEIDDFRFTLVPRATFVIDQQRLRLATRAQATVRRHADNQTENSVAALADLDGAWRLSQADTFSFGLRANRAVEDRGEPESLTDPAVSPRKYNLFSGNLGYRRQAGRTLLSARLGMQRTDAVRKSDRERDSRQWSAQARFGVRASGTATVFVDGFVTTRDFDLRQDVSGVNRDSRTIGARGGFIIDPGGLIRGEAAIGLFRFNPDDPTLNSRTGVSASASLIYQPRERTAFTLDAFHGDVATVRTGAQSRTDTRVAFGIQQEARHNLRLQAGVIYRRTRFIGNGQRERTFGGIAEVEYLLNRRMAVALQGRLANRDGTDPADDSHRRSIGLELRFQY